MKLCTDMSIRWNSTYLMLEKALPTAKQITDFVNRKNYPEEVVNYDDWAVCELFYSFLKFFYDATNTLSGIYYPTTNLVLDILVQIAKIFVKYRYNDVLREIVSKIEEKYEKY